MGLIPQRLYDQLTEAERLQVNDALAGIRTSNHVECPSCGAVCEVKLQGRVKLAAARRAPVDQPRRTMAAPVKPVHKPLALREKSAFDQVMSIEKKSGWGRMGQ